MRSRRSSTPSPGSSTSISEQLVEHPADPGEGRPCRRHSDYGVKPGDVRRIASTFMAGEEVGDIFNTGKAYDVVVWSVPESRGSLTDVENLLIDTADGGKVALKDDRGRHASRRRPAT